MGASVLLVGGTLAPDTDFQAFLEGKGHSVTEINSYTEGAPTDLTGVDLVIVSRSTSSGDYDDGTEPNDWNALDVPLILMSSYLTRTNRWGWFNTTTVTADVAVPTDYSAFSNPNHPYVSGLGTSVFPSTFDSGAPLTIDWVGTVADVPAGANVVSTMTIGAAADAVGIVEIPEGTTLFNNAAGAASTLVAPRVYFQMNEYPDADDVFTLSSNGGDILNQIINSLVDNPTIPGDVTGDGNVDVNDYNVIKANFQKNVAVRTQGDLNNDGLVNFADFRQWKSNRTDLGSVVDPSGAVPEPTGITLLVSTALAFGFVVKKRR